jgi:group I intron endonuclease
MEKIIGVYKIYNKANKKVYIGGSSNCRQRKQTHFRDLRNNVHECPELQEDYNIYGKKYFKFKLIKKCILQDLLSTEGFYIEKYKSYIKKFGYNKDRFINGKKKRIKSTCNKISEAGKLRKGIKYPDRKISEETRKKLRDSHLGKVLTDEQKIKISLANKGKVLSEETKKKIGNGNRGKKMSEEQKEYLRELKTGKPLHSEEMKKYIGSCGIGRVFSEESRKKKSETMKRKYAEERRLGIGRYKKDYNKNKKAISKDGRKVKEE